MYTRKFGDENISILGLGCMRLPKISPDKEDIDKEAAQKIVDYAYENGVNYFDTAWMYHGGKSEEFIGPALKKYPRESYNLVSKMPVWEAKDEADLERIFATQLERTGADYFDFYLCHSVDNGNWPKYKEYHVFDFLAKKKEEGKIRHIGFSFHGTPELLEEEVINAHPWEFAQIQFNYVDWDLQNAKKTYEIIEKKGIPCIIMEPVRGGALANPGDAATKLFKDYDPDASVASWAIRFAATHPNVLTVLSGMSNMEQVMDNVATLSDFKPLSEEEMDICFKAAYEYRIKDRIPCTGCRYCMDCPAGVDIPKVFEIYNDFTVNKNRQKFIDDYRALEESKRADKCIGCGACEAVCPQSIKIPDNMEKISKVAKDFGI